MPTLVEFQVPLNMSLEEFNRAWLFMVVEASCDQTGGGEGVEILKNEPYDNTDGHLGVSEISDLEIPKTKGQYTLKEYHLASKVPGVVKAMLPADALILVEEAWNAFPHCRTHLTNKYLSNKKFIVTITTTFHPGSSVQTRKANAQNLTTEQLARRKVVVLDVKDVDPEHEHYKKEYDPKLFTSAKTGRGKLGDNWFNSADPGMTCYKVVEARFDYWPLRSKIENKIINMQTEAFLYTHARAFCQIDGWYDMTMDHIRTLEEAAKEALQVEKADGESKGNGDASAAAAANGGVDFDALLAQVKQRIASESAASSATVPNEAAEQKASTGAATDISGNSAAAAPGAPAASETPETPETPQAPEATEATEAPEAPAAPEAPEAPAADAVPTPTPAAAPPASA